MKKIYKYFKHIKNKTFLFIGILTFIIGAIFSVSFGVGYMGPVIFVVLLIYFSMQGDNEHKQNTAIEQRQERMQEIKKLEKKAEIIRNHIETNTNDLNAKLQLHELEEKIAEMINSEK